MTGKRPLLAVLLLSYVAVAHAQSNPPLRLEKTISMPDVQGRIDHMFFDARSARLFVAALGNNTVEVIDVKQGNRVHTISGLHEPQGILYLSGPNRLYVANGDDGTLRIFDGSSYQPLSSTKLGDDADNVRWDGEEHKIYVGYGRGALALIDEKGARIGDIQLDAHPESFRLEPHATRIFVNLPESRKIAVVDKKARSVIATWTTDDAFGNFPMALDEATRRLFVVCRRPARLLALDIDSGRILGAWSAVGDCDDVFYDAAMKRIYATGGEVEFPFSNNRSRIITTKLQVFRRERERAQVFSLQRPTRSSLQRGGRDRTLPPYTSTVCSINRGPKRRLKISLCLAVLIWTSSVARAQTASLRGQVFDESGAVVPNAAVTLTGKDGQAKTVTASKDGSYSFGNLLPGQYVVHASAPKLEGQPVPITLKQGLQTLRLNLKVAALQQQLMVQENSGPVLSTESASNASALVLKGKDLQTLADDPEELGSDLQALAGPAAGPGGNSIYVDGFSGGQLPPKDAIREIRINQNPFSPEYDELGYGRVEVLTKPGANKFHGTGYYNFGDSVWNSRNPYAAEKAPFLLKEYGASLEGPLSKLASFFVTVDRAAIDNGAIINGTTVDTTTLAIINPYTQVFTIPQRRIRVSPRVDYQLTPNDTLSARYQFSDADIQHSGVGRFNLVSTGIHNHGTDQTIQLSNALVLGANAMNETRFQFYRAHISSLSEDPSAQLDVLNSFIGGGAQVGNSFNTLNTYEFQNYATLARSTHTLRLGIRVRASLPSGCVRLADL